MQQLHAVIAASVSVKNSSKIRKLVEVDAHFVVAVLYVSRWFGTLNSDDRRCTVVRWGGEDALEDIGVMSQRTSSVFVYPRKLLVS